MELKKLGIPTRTVNALKKKDIFTAKDLVEFFPRRYQKYTEPKRIEHCEESEYAAICAKQEYVTKKQMRGRYKNYLLFRFTCLDSPTAFYVSLFYDVPKLPQYAKNSGEEVVVCGRVRHDPQYGTTMDDISAIIPKEKYRNFYHCVYSKIAGVSDEKMEEMRAHLLSMAPEILEPGLLEEADVMGYKEALYQLHYPHSDRQIEKAKERIRFNNLFYFARALEENAVDLPLETTKAYHTWEKAQRFVAGLPFQLTAGPGGQAEVLNQLFINAKKGRRNNILLQGDVGCGKTVVAAALMVYSEENGYQSVMMAPRGVLARQHYEEIKGYADELGIRCVFLQSDMRQKERRDILKEIASGEAQFIIGTHSCIAKDVKYKNLGAVITDEEHLFGVNQKKALLEKAKSGVHSLSMSATPIPRTMATVIYGNQKEIMVISQKPAGRRPIQTNAYTDRSQVFARMEEEIQKGHQCYVVCPAIEDNDKTDLISIERVEKDYRDHFEPKGIRVGIVNGKMKAEEAKKVIADYVENQYQILISTTVIEVGVNVPNATVMVIEQADRFGLASLHQLRGRVGRSDKPSFCALLCEDPENERIQVMCRTNDGFEIAEADLKQRGSGDLIGTAQSGMNQYVEEMLAYPDLFSRAEAIAKTALEKNHGVILSLLYEEHATLQEAYEKTIKNKRKR